MTGRVKGRGRAVTGACQEASSRDVVWADIRALAGWKAQDSFTGPGPCGHVSLAGAAWNPGFWWQMHPRTVWLCRGTSVLFLFLNIKYPFSKCTRDYQAQETFDNGNSKDFT